MFAQLTSPLLTRHADSSRSYSPPSSTTISQTTSVTTTPHPLDHFKLMAHYEVRAKIGEGKASELYLAFHAQSESYRTIKVVQPHPQHGNTSVYLERQGVKAATAQKLPGVVTIHEHEYHQGKNEFCYVMDAADDISEGQAIIPVSYVPLTLAARVRRQDYSLAEALPMITALARAVNTLHEKELLHRDIKPENILFFGDTPIVGDIGTLCHRRDSNMYLYGRVAGSEGYLAPEFEATVRADIFNLGKTVEQILSPLGYCEAPPISWYRMFAFFSGRDQILDKTLQSMCARHPKNRFSSAAEVLQALSSVGCN